MTSRRLLRWALYLAGVVPMLVIASLLAGLLTGGAPVVGPLTMLAIWAGGMLWLWVLLRRWLPDGEG